MQLSFLYKKKILNSDSVAFSQPLFVELSRTYLSSHKQERCATSLKHSLCDSEWFIKNKAVSKLCICLAVSFLNFKAISWAKDIALLTNKTEQGELIRGGGGLIEGCAYFNLKTPFSS